MVSLSKTTLQRTNAVGLYKLSYRVTSTLCAHKKNSQDWYSVLPKLQEWRWQLQEPFMATGINFLQTLWGCYCFFCHSNHRVKCSAFMVLYFRADMIGDYPHRGFFVFWLYLLTLLRKLHIFIFPVSAQMILLKASEKTVTKARHGNFYPECLTFLKVRKNYSKHCRQA